MNHFFSCYHAIKLSILLYVILIIVVKTALAFNDDYNSVSTVSINSSINSSIDTRLQANLPYSACRMDTPPLNKTNCKIASLKFGSEIFNTLFHDENAITDINYTLLTESKAVDLVNSYFIGNQDFSIIWALPTVPQLEWMVENELIVPFDGEFFWVQSSTGTGVQRASYLTPSDIQPVTQASIHRIANNFTPSNCTQGVDCNLFDNGAEYQFEFPQSIDLYIDGTLVGYDGGIYRCRPFPSSGYCTQWNPDSTQFEPKVGAFWEMAWEYIGPIDPAVPTAPAPTG